MKRCPWATFGLKSATFGTPKQWLQLEGCSYCSTQEKGQFMSSRVVPILVKFWCHNATLMKVHCVVPETPLYLMYCDVAAINLYEAYSFEHWWILLKLWGKRATPLISYSSNHWMEICCPKFGPCVAAFIMCNETTFSERVGLPLGNKPGNTPCW